MASSSDSELEYDNVEDLLSEEEEDSDAELQEAFAQGKLKPGTYTLSEKVLQKEVNDISGLKAKLKELQKTLPWIETLALTSKPAALAPELDLEIKEHGSIRTKRMQQSNKDFTLEDDPVHNDFKREMLFYRQAQSAVLEGYEKLSAMKLPTIRPEDYYAEMAKSDDHMTKVRQRIQNRKVGQEMSERVKKIREYKKFGKKLQVERMQQKAKEKREMLDQVKQFRKGKTDKIDFISDKPLRDGKSKKEMKKELEASKKKRRFKDRKYGGGKKKVDKRNNFKTDKGPKKNNKLKQKRPGKNARKNMKK